MIGIRPTLQVDVPAACKDTGSPLVGFDCYKWYKSPTLGAMCMRGQWASTDGLELLQMVSKQTRMV